jgi:hypothetical protein
MKIRKDLKLVSFEYDDVEKSITIETRSPVEPIKAHIETDEEYAERVAAHDAPINGRIVLNKVYAFSLMRFVVRIAQRNWFRKLK